MRPQEARFVAGAAEPGAWPPCRGPEIAFAGRSNVGKSSLINAVVGRGRPARVSRTPGRTREVNFFAFGSICALVDLPGYGYARVPRQRRAAWRPLVESYLTSGRPLRLVLLLVDSRHPPAAADAVLVRFLRSQGLSFAVALTKVDALPAARRPTVAREAAAALGLEAGECPLIGVSTRTGAGIDRLRDLVLERARS